MTIRIGSHVLRSNVVLAPMAGVTDRPFRILCRRFGAALAASEMLTADVRLWHTTKSRRRNCNTEMLTATLNSGFPAARHKCIS